MTLYRLPRTEAEGARSEPRLATPVVEPPTSIADVRIPLVVDLDNSLLLTDSLHEHLAAAFFRSPIAFCATLPSLCRGRAALKAELASKFELPCAHLPLCTPLIEWLQKQANNGREIHLCSAAHQSIVDAIARRVGIFASATGSQSLNLKGESKAEYLATRFPDGFVYVGDSFADLAVWKAARGIVLANASRAVGKAARSLGKPVEAEFARQALTTRDVLKALKVHHWAKNALIFVPLVLGHAWTDSSTVARTALGLICLLLVTSGSYLLNDIADLEADRRHWSKSNRALASGRLPIATAFPAALAALMIAFAVAAALSPSFAATLGGYLVLTLSYSLGLKRVPLLDTFVIAGLFVSRLVMGVFLANQALSAWFLTFSMFFFYSLATAKRHTELVHAAQNSSHSLSSRGYRPEDAPLTLVIGVASSIASLLIMVLFIVEEIQKRNLYAFPGALWAIPALLALWVSRIWLLAHRGEMTDDPVSFALRDKVSLGLGLATAVSFAVAL